MQNSSQNEKPEKTNASTDQMKVSDISEQKMSSENSNQGLKPILTWDQYLSNVTNPAFRQSIDAFCKRWIDEIDDSINIGQVGFTAGLLSDGRRIPIQWVFDSKICIILEGVVKNFNIPDNLYRDYLIDLKQSADLYDKFIASGKRDVKFSSIDVQMLNIILNSSLKLAKRFKETVNL